MVKSKSKTVFFTLIFMVIIIGLGVALASTINKKKSSNTSSPSSQNNSDVTVKDSSANYSGTVVYAAKTSNGTDIYTISASSAAKKVFTDKDEDNKIKSAKSITSSGKVLAVMAPAGQEFGGSLYLISTDGSGKKEQIINEFASTQAPLISPDGKKIAYLVFSNVEADYGYALYVENSDGSNKQLVSKDPSGLDILSWNKDSSKIVYAKGNLNQNYDLYIGDAKTLNEKKISSFKEKIYSLDWGKDKFILSKGPTAQGQINKAELFTMDEDGKNLKRISQNEVFENFPKFSPSNDLISYVNVTYDNNMDINKSGQIDISDTAGQNIKTISEGNYLIGWLN